MATDDKAYVVTSGEYSDYEIEGVFTSRENAERFVRTVGQRYDRRIEEHPLDPYERQVREGLSPWYVRMTMDGTVTNCRSKETLFGIDIGARIGSDGQVYATVFARDPQHAIKIVNEKRVQLKATPK